MNREEKFMREALKYAKIAYDIGEIPVGAVIVKGDDIISFGYNRRQTGKNAMFHAETEAIYSACNKLGGWRLWDCEMYVTLEPCPMCAGAIVNARIKNVYFGAYDEKNGGCASVLNIFDMQNNFRPKYKGGILKEECSVILKDFFKALRIKDINNNTN